MQLREPDHLLAAVKPYVGSLAGMSMTPLPEQLNPAEFTAEADHLVVARPESGLVVVTLSYPNRRNAMSAQMTNAWARLVPALAGDKDLRCVVITGEGSSFCSGGDTGWIGAEPHATVDELRARMTPFYRTWLAIRDLEVPVVVGLNGPAVGAGACVALAGDVRIAAVSAAFSVPFLKLGMHPGMATTYLLPEVVGVAAARDLLFTGRTVRAQEMRELGIVSQVLPDEGFTEAVVDVGRGIAANAPFATRLTKAALRDGGPGTLADSVTWEALAQPVTLATADLQEGLAAAREKRPAEFLGR